VNSCTHCPTGTFVSDTEPLASAQEYIAFSAWANPVAPALAPIARRIPIKVLVMRYLQQETRQRRLGA
jgi:hypothetical protein